MAFKRKPRKTSTVYNIDDVLHATMKIIEDRPGGYISQKAAGITGEVPTSQFVLQLLRTGSVGSYHNVKYDARIEEIKFHFSNPPGDNDEFLNTVYQLFCTGMVSENKIGYIAALPTMYESMKGRTTKLMKIAEKYSTSNYMGEIGKPDSFAVKLVDITDFKQTNIISGEQEKHYLYRVTDRIGNCGLIFSVFPPRETPGTSETAAFKLWDCFEFKGTPKKQEPNKDTGIKETVFGNVTVTEMIGQGTEE
jgi:hypothetical protein